MSRKKIVVVNDEILQIKSFKLYTVKPVQTAAPCDQLLCSERIGIWFLQVKLTKISYIGTSYKVKFVQDSVLFWVQFGQVSL